jgi:hypothetical protein
VPPAKLWGRAFSKKNFTFAVESRAVQNCFEFDVLECLSCLCFDSKKPYLSKNSYLRFPLALLRRLEGSKKQVFEPLPVPPVMFKF